MIRLRVELYRCTKVIEGVPVRCSQVPLQDIPAYARLFPLGGLFFVRYLSHHALL